MPRKKQIAIKSKSAEETAMLLGFSEQEAGLMKVRVELRQRVKDAIKAEKITHARLAGLVGTSRERVTRLANDGAEPVSIDFLIKLLSAMGYSTDIKVSKQRKTSVKGG